MLNGYGDEEYYSMVEDHGYQSRIDVVSYDNGNKNEILPPFLSCQTTFFKPLMLL